MGRPSASDDGHHLHRRDDQGGSAARGTVDADARLLGPAEEAAPAERTADRVFVPRLNRSTGPRR